MDRYPKGTIHTRTKLPVVNGECISVKKEGVFYFEVGSNSTVFIPSSNIEIIYFEEEPKDE